MTKRGYIPVDEPFRTADGADSPSADGTGRAAPSASRPKIDFNVSTGRFEVVQEGDGER